MIYRYKKDEHTSKNGDFNRKNDETILQRDDFITKKL